MELSSKIEEQLVSKNISLGQINEQLKQLVQGIEPIKLDRACIKDDGITILKDQNLLALIRFFEQQSKLIDIVKFVPASGAATRMFKHLFGYSKEESNELVTELFDRLDEFPFYGNLVSQFPQVNNYKLKGKFDEIIDLILNKLKYGVLPKGCIKFHNYSSYVLTAFEEHLQEGVDYSVGKNENITIHFTVSDEFKSQIDILLQNRIKSLKVNNTITIEYSKQLSNTDTIAVDLSNNLLKSEDRTLVFRPGGHGALIHNLNTIDADLIFIKNIDNVVPDSKRKDTIQYKKALGGLALEIKQKRDLILKVLDNNQTPDSALLKSIFSLLGVKSIPETNEDIYNYLNRPIRVCGMVKNQGEPGGGPFWVKDAQGDISKQIVEKSQINLSDTTQTEILNNATHFNPVDLICVTKNHQNEKFDLLQFVDENTGFVSEKSIQGKKLKALELPGLWNGAMANWLTVFVEVPLTTFNPVKTVNDLLRPMHQN